MANRVDYYFRQKVTESELDKGFGYLEQADWDYATDLDAVGIANGLTVAQQGTPNMTVAVGAGAAYDQNGRRVRVPSVQNVNCAVDFNGIATTVASPANEKWLAIFVGFTRALSDPRTDGNDPPLTVYFERAESFELRVVQGAEAAIGSAARPALDSGRLLLADVRLTQGQTTVVTANISTTRRQDTFVVAGSPRSLARGTAKSALSDVLGYYNAHVAGADHHAAVHVDYAGGPAWLDDTTNPATSVEGQLDKLVLDLVARAGAARVGAAALPAWADGVVIDQPTIQLALAYLVAQLADVTGAAKLGAPARAGTAFSLGAGSVDDQLDAIQAHIDATPNRLIATYGVDGVAVALNLDGYFDLTSIAVPNVAVGDVLEIVSAVHLVSNAGNNLDILVEHRANAIALKQTTFYLFGVPGAVQQIGGALVTRWVVPGGAEGTVTVKCLGLDVSGNNGVADASTIVHHIRP